MAQNSDLLQAASDGKDLNIFQQLAEDEDIDYYKDKDGNTLLSIAAKNGHENLVKLLLAKDARISIRSSEGKTPLVYAAENGHKGIVELLLHDENFPNSEHLRAAVSEAVLSAAAGGHSSLLRYLIQTYNHDFELQAQMIFNRAAAAGHKEMVKLMLGRYDIDINGNGDSGNTALYLALQAGHKDVVAVLLEREDIDINAESRDGSAFSAALDSGREDLAEMLYARDRIDIDAPLTGEPEKHRTALHHAASSNHTRTVKWLLTKDEVDVNAKGPEKCTPLHMAAEKGHTEIIKLLLARNDIIVNAENDYKETPLHMAIWPGHTEIVKLLLTRNEVMINNENDFGRTPLHWAAEKGHTEIMKLLLARYDIIVNAENADKDTPLHLAIEKGCAEAVKLLLETEKVKFNTQNKEGKTPLHIAVNKGYTEIVMLLLESDAARGCNVVLPLYDAAEKGYTKIVKLLLESDAARGCSVVLPLYNAAEKGYTKIVKLLLSRSEIDVNFKFNDSRTLLHIAAENGNSRMVKLLLKTDGINVNAKTRDDETPLFRALQYGERDVINLLLARDDLDLEAAEFSSGYLITWAAVTEQEDLMDLELARECNAHPSRTPLTRSSEQGYLEALCCLLQRDGIDINSVDSDGRTPLSRAAEKGHSEVVEMLLQCSADCNLKDSDGRTPLSWAAGNEHEGIVKQLVRQDTVTLLLLAREGNKTAIDFLLRFNPDVEQKDDLGQTALHFAAQLGHQDIARALMSQGADANSKDNHGRTPLKLAMKGKYGDIIQVLLEFKASLEGIEGNEWRIAFEKRNEDVVQISRGPDGKHYVNFPTTFSAGEELLQTSAGIESCLYMLSDDLNSSVWSKIPYDVFAQSRLELNKLQITPEMVNDNSLDVSISLRLSINSYPYDQPLSDTGDNTVSRIKWRSMRPKSPGNPWKTVVYLSTLPYGWIPEDGIDILRQFFIHIKSKWDKLCRRLENHLARKRLDQMEFKGKNPDMIDFLANYAQNLANLRTNLIDQTSAAEEFIRHYCLHYNANHIPKSLLELLQKDIELGITKRIADLDQTVRDLLNIEFAWITIHETRVSTKLGQNVMLLTYVSIFYLPLGFCAALWAIPNITDTSTRTPFILTAIIVSLITLVITFNMESVAGSIQRGYTSCTTFLNEKRRPQNSELP